jgi:hypothetical protein
VAREAATKLLALSWSFQLTALVVGTATCSLGAFGHRGG